ncbi:MAG: hypothetical protein HZR80_06725 [Candidatus Heimdallarchaeota archaeon]
MSKIIPAILELTSNNVMFIDLPIWLDILFVIFMCGLVILALLASLILILISQKIQILKFDKLLRLSFSFIIYSFSYLIYFISYVSIFETIDHFSRISTTIPSVSFRFTSIAYPILLIGGMSLASSLLVGNLIWFLFRRKKVIERKNMEEKVLRSAEVDNTD